MRDAVTPRSVRAAILLVGARGLGPNRYGEPEVGSGAQSRGDPCDPSERQLLFYDPDELGEVALGQRESWTVLPNALWRPTELLLQGHTCGPVGGMA